MRAPLHFSHKTEELLSSQQATSRQRGFWAPLRGEKHMGNLWLLKLQPALAPDSPVHPREPEMHVLLFIPLRSPIWCPVLVCELADSREAATVQCGKDASSKILGFQEVLKEMIQLKNITNVLSGNLKDCFRQQTSGYPPLLWPPLEMRSFLSPSFNCWWEPPTENNQLHFDRNIN